MSKSFYITTTLPYVNSDPHIGFAMEIVRADIIARYKRLQGADVFFNTGTDEHGIKILQKAQSENKDPKSYVDEYAAKFEHLKQSLNLSYDNFIRTTDPQHIAAAQAFWTECKKNGYIYKKNYKIKYCVGCELEKTDSELVDGRCPLHPGQDLEVIDEENYFFKFSEFAKPLLELYEKNPDFVIPDFRFNEIRAFVERGLEDFSISRLKSKMPWGVSVPDDSLHVMYVWFDALVNYISAIGWPTDMKKFKKWWPVAQYCGKDNLRQQSAMWQAMLMSVKLPPSRHIIVDGFVNVGGQKMSKSLGNVVNPLDLVNEYGTDALRYYIARELNPFEDSDYTAEKFKESYNANLANGLGNLTSRIMKMAETNLSEPAISGDIKWKPSKEFTEAMESFNLKSAGDQIWKKIGELDEIIQKEQPFKLVKSDPEKGREIIRNLAIELYQISKHLEPFLPETSAKIQEAILSNKTPAIPLFLRKD